MCAHKQLTIFKLYEPPENGARRRPCEAHMGHTPVLSRLTAGSRRRGICTWRWRISFAHQVA